MPQLERTNRQTRARNCIWTLKVQIQCIFEGREMFLLYVFRGFPVLSFFVPVVYLDRVFYRIYIATLENAARFCTQQNTKNDKRWTVLCDDCIRLRNK